MSGREPMTDAELQAMQERQPYWFPRLVGPETVARLRKDYPDETAGMIDEDVLNAYDYFGKYEQPCLWDHTGDAIYSYEPLADAYLELLAEVRRLRARVAELETRDGT